MGGKMSKEEIPVRKLLKSDYTEAELKSFGNYKFIEGFPSYFVTKDGRVYSINYRGKRGWTKQLCFKRDKIGYLAVSLWCDKSKRGKYKRIHRIVAEAFIPNPENKREVNHKDGIKTNNNVENLEWMTTLENIRHGKEHKLFRSRRGNFSHRSKIKEEQVFRIRQRINNGETLKNIAKDYNVDASAIGAIKRGLSFGWLDNDITDTRLLEIILKKFKLDKEEVKRAIMSQDKYWDEEDSEDLPKSL